MTVDVLKVFGPPGTGKTTRLLEIMEHELAAGVPPERVAFLTFTVAARHEARQRAAEKFGFGPDRLKWFRTLHSTAYELLGVAPGTLITQTEGMSEFAHRFGYEFTATGFTEEGLATFGYGDGDRLLAFDHLRRHRKLSIADAFSRWNDDRLTLREARRFCDGYERWKAEDGRMDFTDLLERGAAELPCDVVIVDEAQDLSELQWGAFWRLAAGASRVYIGGDDDQAIYEWAGASPAAFLAQPGSVEVLPLSYRCPEVVSELARRIIERVQTRQPKEWKPRAARGALSYMATVEDASIPEDGSVLMLYRNHRFGDDAVEHLRKLGERYTIRGKSGVAPETARAIIAWERLRKNAAIQGDELEAILSLASLARFTGLQRTAARSAVDQETGSVTARAMESAGWPAGPFHHPWYAVLDRLKDEEFYLRKVVQNGGAAALTAPPRVRLSTIHAAKGTEADHVVLDARMMRWRDVERDPDPERRVWYVGVTRARQTLAIAGLDNPLL